MISEISIVEVKTTGMDYLPCMLLHELLNLRKALDTCSSLAPVSTCNIEETFYFQEIGRFQAINKLAYTRSQSSSTWLANTVFDWAVLMPTSCLDEPL